MWMYKNIDICLHMSIFHNSIFRTYLVEQLLTILLSRTIDFGRHVQVSSNCLEMYKIHLWYFQRRTYDSDLFTEADRPQNFNC